MGTIFSNKINDGRYVRVVDERLNAVVVGVVAISIIISRAVGVFVGRLELIASFVDIVQESTRVLVGFACRCCRFCCLTVVDR